MSGIPAPMTIKIAEQHELWAEQSKLDAKGRIWRRTVPLLC
jgi:hypothetical protein